MTEKVHLLKTARAVAEELKRRDYGTSLRIRMPGVAGKENTGGWRAKIGWLGRNRLELEIWLDKFTRRTERKFYAAITSQNLRAMNRLAKGVARKMRPHRTITNADLDFGRNVTLAKMLKREEFGVPIFERYDNGWNFYGFYDLSARANGNEVDNTFATRAAKFFEDVARTLPRATEQDEEREIYPRQENRKVVTSHLRRERSGWLANERKNLDKHVCQVCGMRFADIYGKLGEDFAEAHHVIPLSKLIGKVETRIEDLRTVCANCHRMLHRMEGNRGDVEKLRAIVRTMKRKIRG